MGSLSNSIKINFVEENVGLIAEVMGPRVPNIGETVAFDTVKQKNTQVSADPGYRESIKHEQYKVLGVLGVYTASYSAFARGDDFEYELVVTVRKL